LVEKGKKKSGSESIKKAKWIEYKSIKDRGQVRLLLTFLDQGEAEVLCLAKELKANLVLVDEERARKSAVLAGFEIVGLMGLLVLAKDQGLIKEVRPFIRELRRKKFWVSDRIVFETLRKAGETQT
jgi:predicted nucleic acid-binding protein